MATDLDKVSPLISEYLTKDIHEIVFDIEGKDGNDGDPWINYLQLQSKDEAGGHDNIIVVRIIDDGDVLVSPDLALAGGAPNSYRFEVTVSKLEWRVTVKREELDAVEEGPRNPRATFDLVKQRFDAAIRQSLVKMAKHSLTKRGCLGVIKSISSNNVVIGSLSTGTGTTATDDPTLENRFREGMALVVSDVLDSGNLKGSSPGDSTTISTITATTSTLTLAMASVPGTWAAGDYIYEKGDSYYDRSKRRVMAGALEWCDFTAAAGSENFFGQDRSLHQNLQAMRYNASGKTYKGAIFAARSRFKVKGRPAPDTVFVNQVAYDAIEDDTDKASIVTVELKKETPSGRVLIVGVTGIRVTNGNGGTMDVVALPFLEYGLFLMGNTKRSPFVLAYTGKLVRTDTKAGLWLRTTATGSVESETIVAYEAVGSTRGAIYCTNPGNWLTGYNHVGS